MKLKAEELEGSIDFFNPRKMSIAVIAYYTVYTNFIVGYGKDHICVRLLES